MEIFANGFTQFDVSGVFYSMLRTNIGFMIANLPAQYLKLWMSSAAIAIVVFVGASSASAAPKSDLWPRWDVHDPAATTIVNHAAWSRILEAHLRPHADGVARFDYGGMDGRDREALETYIVSLSKVRVSALNRGEQLAYWINFYNALTVKTVRDHYPVGSILKIDISPGFFAIGPWGKKLVTVEGEALSLDDIEYRILRPIWRDPRIHYAVNCASIGCPNLLPFAYTADQVDRLLTENAIAYVNHPRGVDLRNGELTLSNIYDWFQEDFGGSETGVLAHLREYERPELRTQLRPVLGVTRYDYEWSLNGVANP
jgi:hypothetical protein